MALAAFLPFIMSALSGKKSEYTPYKFEKSTDKDTGKRVFSQSPGMDQMDLEHQINSAANDVADDPDVKSGEFNKEGYGDASSWAAAATSLLSDLERERQAKVMNLQNQASMSANYGLNAMGAAGSALDRLNRGRMGGMGLSSMAGR